jgi:hypothetical protein
MTVAPELRPVSTARAGGARRVRAVRARRVRAVRVDRTPAGVVALVEPPRPRVPVVAPAPLIAPDPPVEPGVGREHRPTDPTSPARGRTVRPAVPAPVVQVRPVGRRAVGQRVVRPAPGPLRLTRRGRLVSFATALLIAGVTLVGVASRAGSLHETAAVPASVPAQVVVAPGETLWSIAQRVAPDRDPRTVVAGIQRLNGLRTAEVHAGQTLVLRAP